LGVDAPGWQGAKTQDNGYSEFSQHSRTGRIGVQSETLFLREPSVNGALFIRPKLNGFHALKDSRFPDKVHFWNFSLKLQPFLFGQIGCL
jgi:hypothetical protein